MLNRWGTRRWIGMGLALITMMPAGRLLNAQQNQQQYQSSPQMNLPSSTVPDDPNLTMSNPERLSQIAKRNKALNIMRQQALVADTDKLLKLAQELNAGTAAGGTTMSASERMKKLAQIEKLAKRVREKMSYAQWFAPSDVPSTYSVINP